MGRALVLVPGLSLAGIKRCKYNFWADICRFKKISPLGKCLGHIRYCCSPGNLSIRRTMHPNKLKNAMFYFQSPSVWIRAENAGGVLLLRFGRR